MSLDRFEKYFNSEVRSSGYRYFSEEKVSVSQPSDTEIRAYIKSSTAFKVSLKSPSMASSVIVADCTCPAAKKGRLCKHIWATLLAVEDKRAEYLEDKNELEKKSVSENPVQASTSISSAQVAFKAKQETYRKAQYQKQKQRLKDFKNTKSKKTKAAANVPEVVEIALAYFSENGFPMENPLQTEPILLARKKLSRVFHPDIGGSHAETVELNKHSEVLLNYLESRGTS